MTDLERYRAEQLLDPDFRDYALEMQAVAELSKAVAEARMQMNLTQAELANLSGLTQSQISNIESCEGNPSMKTLSRIARGLNMRIEIKFVTNGEENEE